MDRKIKPHMDKPARQRWLYQLLDMGMSTALGIIWAVVILALIIALGIVKLVVYFHK